VNLLYSSQYYLNYEMASSSSCSLLSIEFRGSIKQKVQQFSTSDVKEANEKGKRQKPLKKSIEEAAMAPHVARLRIEKPTHSRL
jgi:hypothetical protein